MNTQDYLDELLKEGQSHVKTRSIGAIGRVKIEMGYHLCPKGRQFWDFWKPILSEGNPKAASKAAFDSCKEKLETAGYNEGPKFGTRITIHADILSGNHYASDYSEFVEIWTDAGKMIIDSVSKSQLPTNETFYGQVKYIPDPYRVAQGEEGKIAKDKNGDLFDPPRFPNVLVPIQKFANEKEALDFVEANSSNNTVNSLSEAAQSSSEEILSNWKQTRQGVLPKSMEIFADTFPSMPEKMTPAEKIGYQNKIKEWLADLWDIPVDDIDKLEAQDIAF